MFKGISVSYCFCGVLELSLTCKGLRTLCLQNFFRWWKQIRRAMRNPYNLAHIEKVSFMAVVKISATVTKFERSAVSSVVDTVSSVTASSDSTCNTVELERQIKWRDI